MDKHNYYLRRCKIDGAIRNLQLARDALAEAGATNTLAKVRSALKSADGARRHADGMVQRTITQRRA